MGNLIGKVKKIWQILDFFKMSSQTLVLSASGLKNIVLNSQEKEDEFKFIFGDKEIKLHRLFAEFVSPKVAHMHQCDPTIDHLNLSDLTKNISTFDSKIQSEILTERTFNTIEALSIGYSVEIEEGDINNLQLFSAILENEELFNKMNELSQKVQSKQTSYEDIIKSIQIYDIINTEFADKYVSSKIDEINEIFSSEESEVRDKLSGLSKSVLSYILRNDKFKVRDNDKLFDIIKEMNTREEEEENVDFYELIDISSLSEEKFCDFLSIFDYREMTGNIWRQICEFVTNKCEPKRDKKVRRQEDGSVNIEYDGDTSHQFSGVVNYIIKNKNDNETNDDVINVTASSTSGSHYPKYAVEFDSNEYFLSNHGSDWLQYDFKGKKIRPTSYSVRTRDDSDRQNPLSWEIEVSNTGNENDWKTIDSREKETSVSKRNQNATFNIQTTLSPNDNYRYIRFKCTGNTSRNCACLAISSLEYFGTLIK